MVDERVINDARSRFLSFVPTPKEVTFTEKP